MTAVAFLALGLAVVVQSLRLHKALIREQQLRAEAAFQFQVAQAEHRRAQAEVARYRQTLAIVGKEMHTGIAEQHR